MGCRRRDGPRLSRVKGVALMPDEMIAAGFEPQVASALDAWRKSPPPATGAVAPVSPVELARRIDHTLLKPTATEAQIRQICAEAVEHGFATVCVNPVWVPLCARLTAGSPVGVCTVIGFPLGATSTEVKVFEAQTCAVSGARELDMVISVGQLQSGDHVAVFADITAVVSAAHALGASVKVIIEAAFLSDEEKVVACALSKAAGADYVKTSTGFGPGGATAADVALMRRVVGDAAGVKAAGGIRTAADAFTMLAAGASRIGASASIAILREAAAATSSLTESK
jgi:deoxyribose-phosphate aldolase